MATSTDDIYYDPYDFEIDADPHPIFRRLRDESPLYRNERLDFYAVSRFADVESCSIDWRTFVSGRGTVLEIIRSEMDIPRGMFIFEDPPLHNLHRRLMTRVFTPRRVPVLEARMREYCAVALDEGLRIEDGRPPARGNDVTRTADTSNFAEYIAYRREHPSDDLMTDLIQATFADEHGVERHLDEEEVLNYALLLAAAGNETTTRLIGWTGYLLGAHPEQRRLLVESPGLMPGAIEEILRYEAPSPVQARCVTRDVELHGTSVPTGSVMLLLTASANRDDRQFDDPDRFNVRRVTDHHVTFGHGLHFCMGAALARLEGRVALEEVLARFPDWEVDHAGAERVHTTTVRGWHRLPVFV